MSVFLVVGAGRTGGAGSPRVMGAGRLRETGYPRQGGGGGSREKWEELRTIGTLFRITVPNFGISQSEALFTVLISYDIKPLTWYPTISWTVCKICVLLLALEMKITTKIQRNVKLVCWLKEKAIC